jgi:hypothetical protein
MWRSRARSSCSPLRWRECRNPVEFGSPVSAAVINCSRAAGVGAVTSANDSKRTCPTWCRDRYLALSRCSKAVVLKRDFYDETWCRYGPRANGHAALTTRCTAQRLEWPDQLDGFVRPAAEFAAPRLPSSTARIPLADSFRVDISRTTRLRSRCKGYRGSAERKSQPLTSGKSIL